MIDMPSQTHITPGFNPYAAPKVENVLLLGKQQNVYRNYCRKTIRR